MLVTGIPIGVAKEPSPPVNWNATNDDNIAYVFFSCSFFKQLRLKQYIWRLEASLGLSKKRFTNQFKRIVVKSSGFLSQKVVTSDPYLIFL